MKNKIYKIKSIIIAGVAMLLLPLSSCENQLESEPYSFFTSANFFSNQDEANMATLGVYEIMANYFTYGWNITHLYDIDTDISQMTGDTPVDWRVIPHYKGIPTTISFYDTWSRFYNGIDRANTVIEKIPKMELYTTGTENQKIELNKMIGEAKFLRGFYYFELVRMWGDVPFKTKSSQTGDNFNSPLVDRYEIYTQIIKDMQEAAEVLPTALPTNERINKWGAKAMLARVALFAGGYSLRSDGQMKRPDNYKDYYLLAQQQINDIMAENPYKLNPKYSQVYKNQCQHVLDPTESIFQVAFYNVGSSSNGGNNTGNFNAPATDAGVYSTTGARIMIMKPFYSSFVAGDLRRDFSIATYRINALGNKTHLLTGRSDESWTPGKWSREYQTQPNQLQERSSTNINQVIMRYSDLLLMRAEVENELNEGPNTIAYDAINQVRRRGFGTDVPGSGIAIDITSAGTGYSATANVLINITGGGGTDASSGVVALGSGGSISTIAMFRSGEGYTSVPTVTVTTTDAKGTGAVLKARLLPKPTATQVNLSGLDKASFLKAIQNERAWELSNEGMRRADLIRWQNDAKDASLLSQKIAETKTAILLIRSNYSFPAYDNFTKNKHELYPFPSNEIEVNKAITRQNPNYSN